MRQPQQVAGEVVAVHQAHRAGGDGLRASPPGRAAISSRAARARARRSAPATTSRTACPSRSPAMAAASQAGRPGGRRGALQDDQGVDRGVEQRVRRSSPRSSRIGQQIVAEVLLKHQAVGFVGGDDAREPTGRGREMRGDAEERPRRPRAAARPSGRRDAVARDAQVAAEAGVLRERLGVGPGEAVAGEEDGDDRRGSVPRARSGADRQ